MISRWIARHAAGLAHQLVDEYRKLEPPAAAPAEISCTQARIDARWQPTDIAPASGRAEFGFRAPPGIPSQAGIVDLVTWPPPQILAPRQQLVAHECEHQASNFTPCRICGA